MAVVRRRIRLSSSLVGVLGIALVVSGGGMPLVASAEPPAAPSSAAASSASAPSEKGDLSRPDQVSAAVTARASGKRVEDESQRTEFTRVYANPDGTWTNETAAGPVSARDEAGVWQDIDTTLVERDGALVPRVAATELKLSDGGDRVFASMSRDGHDLGWRWDAPLPEPVVEGATATYPGAVEGGDLVVTATATGFTHSVVLRERPEEPVEIAIPVATDGGDLVEGANGQLTITKPNENAALLTAPAPLMWDASQAVDSVPVESEPSGQTLLVDTAVGETAAGTPELTLTPDADFLNDPDTVYPVTIDPSFSMYTSGDTWVSNKTPSSQEISSELRVGTQDLGTTKSRSYVRFNGLLGSIPGGADVKSASLVIRNFDSLSCNSSPIEVAQVASDWTLSGISWSGQPTMTALHQATYDPAKGYSSACPGGDAVWNVTGIVNDWNTGATQNRGLRIKANDETVNKSYRRYRSSDYATTIPLTTPYMNVTYNRLPGQAELPWPSPLTSYTPPGGPSTFYTNTNTPTFTTRAPDADGDTIGLMMYVYHAAYPEWGPFTSCQTPAVPQNTYTSCASTSPLPEGPFSVRAKAGDYYNWSGGGTLESEPGWGPKFTFTVDTQAPPAPTLVADHATQGGWNETRPASNRFTITGAPDTASFEYMKDLNGTALPLAASNNTATLDWNPANGEHTLSVRTIDRAGNVDKSLAGWKHFTWGVAGSEVATRSKVPTSTDTFPLSLSGPPNAIGARLSWRYAASGEDASWTDVDLKNVKRADGSDWSGSVTPGAAGSEVNDLIWSATDEKVPGTVPSSNIAAPSMLEVRACFKYSGTSDVCDTAPLQLVQSAFGGNFPVADAGPGRVALRTGEFATDATDVTVAGSAGSTLSVARSYGSYTGPSALPARNVFGPGWSAALDGSEAGIAGMQLTDNTAVDGTLVLSSPTAQTLTFAPNGGWKERTGNALNVGEWIGVDELTPSLGLKAQVAGTGADTKFVVTNDSGVVTTFKVTTAPATPTTSNPGAAVFAPESVQEPGSGKTSYERDSQGRITRILGALPTGMTAADCAASSWAAGCRALEIDYATATTATAGTPGDVTGQVQRVRLRVFDAAKPAGETKTVSSYAYDTGKRLVAVTSGLTGLTTAYGYDGDGRLATMTPPGSAPYQVEYDGDDDRLSRVKRDRPATSGGGTATLAAVIYGLRPDVATEGLPDMRPAAVAAWGQTNAPFNGAAVFGPDKPVSTLKRTEVSAADWPYARLWYTDFLGRTVNTATYGAGKWQPTFTEYDNIDNPRNPLREFGAGDVEAIRSGALTSQSTGTKTVYNTAANGPANTPAGTVVTDVYGPARLVRGADGTPRMLRPHTHTTYDEGAPNGGINPETDGGWAMPTTVTTDAVDSSALTVVGDPVSVVKTTYGDAAGWTLGTPTTSTTVMGGGQANIVTTAAYDAAGRVVEQRQPKSNGTDAGTRRTVYYTKVANADFPACGGKADWEGLVCRIYSPGNSANGSALPVTTISGYNQLFLLPETTAVSSGAVTRTTSSTYDSAGRSKKTWTTISGGASVPAPGSELEYDDSSGRLIKQWATDATGARTSEHIDTGYDAWGRTSTYTPYGDPATTTTYDTAGRVATVADPKGTTTFSYDGDDAAGKAERRGFPTKVSVTAPSGDLEFSGAYDADGNLTLEQLPGDITRRATYDTAGQQVGLSYSGAVNRPEGGETTTDPDAPWLAWSLDRDIAGRVIGEATPDAAAPTGKLAAGMSAAYSRGYSYDRAGRLTKVIDRTAPAGAAQYDAGANLTGTVCQTREYGFDANGNRTSLTRRGANADGTCSAAVASTKTWSYDTADRYDTGSGYTYDDLGRVTTMPAGDTPTGAGAGDVSLGYYDTDAVRTITQSGTTSTYTLDAAGRRATEVAGPDGGAADTTVTSHFTDGSDSPTWVQKATSAGTTSSRYIETLDGALGATITGSSVSLALANPHGDTVTTVSIPDSGPADGIDGWSSTDEYGNPTGSSPGSTPLRADTGIGYGWLGARQRATADAGLLLMGSRVYNPATGTFTSADPIYGGNSTAYGYPQDPVNGSDLTGNSGSGYNPRELYSACRKAGGGRIKCGKVVKFSYDAKEEAGQFVDNYASNAYRHFIWNAGMTALFGSKIATAVANAHEGDDKSPDSKADRRNNRVGRTFGSWHAQEIKDDRENGDWDFLFSSFGDLYRGHWMSVVNKKGTGVVASCTHGRMNSC